MDVSRLQSLNEFAFIAIAVAAAYLGTIWFVTLLARLTERFRTSRHTSCRPGELIHQALKVSGRIWDHYRTAALLFGVSFVLLVNFGRYGWVEPKAFVINVLVGIVLLLPLAFAALKFVQLARYRMRLAKLLDLHTQMAQRLVEAQLRGNRVYPSVRINDGMLDNVVVGANGIYAVQLFAPPPGAESVSYERGGLVFQPGGHRVILKHFSNRIRGLTSVLAEEAGRKVTVLPVIVVPDCRIENNGNDGPELVSLQACASFVSWQNNDFFLHDEDVAKISGWLGKQHLKDPPRTLHAAVESLERKIDWPALV
jgi:hypothetical protein